MTDAAARGLAIALKQGGGEVTMRLRPDALGAMKVQMRVEDARVWAQLVPGSESARELLAESLFHLRTALEAQGLTVERLDVAPPPEASRSGTIPGRKPEQPLQDAMAQTSGAEASQPQAPSDGSGGAFPDSAEPRSGEGETRSGGNRAALRTEALEDIVPDSPWGFHPGAVSAGAMEWLA